MHHSRYLSRRCQVFRPVSLPFRNYATANTSSKKEPLKLLDMKQYQPSLIRNFCIIAHIDHGKSTLADRLLELTHTISASADNKQFLDKLQVEKERGITVKAQTCAMFYEHSDGQKYLLNLIDTPGHVDFNYEVSRSMAACDCALLLVDSGQGIEAQTLANYYLAMEQNLTIIPILTKIDQQTAQPEIMIQQMVDILGIDPNDIIRISAKTGLNCDQVLPAIVKKCPPPSSSSSTSDNNIFKALIFDSWFDEYFGVVSLIYIASGSLKQGDVIVSHYSKKSYDVQTVGVMHPEQTPTTGLFGGQVGYVMCGMKTTKEANIGDTFYHKDKPVDPLPGFKKSKPMVFAGIYPIDNDDYPKLRDAIEKLILTDSSVTLQKETSAALGSGFRCGFLGLLHLDVFKQRLDDEFGAQIIITTPTVTYKMKKSTSEQDIFIDNPNQFPDDLTRDMTFYEPMVQANIMTPRRYMTSLLNLCQDKRGEQVALNFINDDRVHLIYKLPLNEIIQDFFDRLKSISQGYATLDYEEVGYQQTEVVKLTVLLNKESVDALTFIVHKSRSLKKAKEIVSKLKEIISRQLFEISIQACIGHKVVASEKLQAFRKNVTAKCYGGDISRKRKLLEKQKEGKKRMKQIGTVHVPQEAFLQVFK
jgi:elongation factor 4